MVWARTYAVGCGAFRCAELEGAEEANENALFLVCYYGPGLVWLWSCNMLIMTCILLVLSSGATLLMNLPIPLALNPVKPAPTHTSTALTTYAVSVCN